MMRETLALMQSQFKDPAKTILALRAECDEWREKNSKLKEENSLLVNNLKDTHNLLLKEKGQQSEQLKVSMKS